MYWSYLIKGCLPKYKPPVILTSTMDNRLDPQTSSRLMHTASKNFIVENIRNSKVFSKNEKSMK